MRKPLVFIAVPVVLFAVAARWNPTETVSATTTRTQTLSVARIPFIEHENPTTTTTTTTTTVPVVAEQATRPAQRTTTTTEPAPADQTGLSEEPVSETGTSESCWGWYDTVAALWPANQVTHACYILGRESRGDPAAHNPSGASGLMQLMPVHAHYFEEQGWSYNPDVYDGYKNLVVAHLLYLDSGWGPWGG